MNKALFLFTMKRYFHWITLLLNGTLLLVGSASIGTLLLVDSDVSNEIARGLLFGPILPILIAYSIVIPQVANSQRRKDGEYLSLIFSRPVSRCSYVLTKWLSGGVLTFSLMVLAAALAFGVAACFGHHPSHILDAYAIADAFLNAFAYSALVVLIASFPSRWGALVLVLVMYSSLILSATVGSLSFFGSVTANDGFRPIIGVGKTLLSTLSVGIDTYHVVNSSSLPLTEISIYSSNVVLYLTIAVFVMSLREFFYAND